MEAEIEVEVEFEVESSDRRRDGAARDRGILRSDEARRYAAASPAGGVLGSRRTRSAGGKNEEARCRGLVRGREKCPFRGARLSSSRAGVSCSTLMAESAGVACHASSRFREIRRVRRFRYAHAP
jgi:hypothetical protein